MKYTELNHAIFKRACVTNAFRNKVKKLFVKSHSVNFRSLIETYVYYIK